MKLTLVSTHPGIYPPLGLAYISSYLRRDLSDLKINIIDTDSNLVPKIQETEPDIIGFTSTTSEYDKVLQCAKVLKQKKDVLIVVGGAHITGLPNSLPPYIDIGVVGEGEETMLELVKGKDFGDIKGICYHRDGKIIVNERRPYIKPLDRIPFPARDLLDMDKYLRPSHLFYTKKLYRGTTMLTSRGCPYRCVYCQASRIWNGVRMHSPEYVVNEIMDICGKYPDIEAINIVDDLFAYNKKRLTLIVKLLRKSGFLQKGIVLNVNGRSNQLNDEIFGLCKEMKVKQMGIGFESGSDKVLGYLKKNTVTVQQSRDVFELAEKYKIDIAGQFMFGSPNEAIEDMQQTLDFIKAYKHRMAHAHVSVTTPLPDTELWDYAKQRNIVTDKIDWSQFKIGFDYQDLGFYLNDKLPKKDFLRFITAVLRETNEINPRFPVPLLSLETIKKAFHNPRGAVKFVWKLINRVGHVKIK